MKRHLKALVATVSMLVGGAPLMAGELPFNAPSTHRAQEQMAVLHRAAHALYDLTPGRAGISDLWLFPTADAGTVFAAYTLRSDGQVASPTGHLAVLTLRGDRIVKVRELTDSVADRSSDPASVDWTAMIGTGGTTKPVNASRDHSSASSADWASKIGTGTAADANSGTKTPGTAAVIVARQYHRGQ